MTTMDQMIPEVDQGHIRRLLPFDNAALRGHLKRLDDESRQLRFGAMVSNSFLDSYADSMYRFDTIIFGYFYEGELRAIGELRPISFDEGGRAEIAFSVEKDWQHKGIGSLLMQRVVMTARNRGFAHVSVFCLPGNDPMRHLAEKFGAHMHMEQGELLGDIQPLPPTPFSYLDESLLAAQDAVTSVLEFGLQLSQAGKRRDGTHR